MSRSSLRALLLTLSLVPLAALRAEDPSPAAAAPDAPALTVEACIARALEQNFSLKIQGFSTTIAQESLLAAEARFEPEFTATTQRSMVQSSLAERRNLADTRLGVGQTLASGALVNLSTSLDRAGYTPLLGTPNPAYTSDLSLSVTQPLLRGAGSAVNRAGVERSKLGLSIAHLGYKGSVLQVIRDTEAAYYNLVFTRGQLAVKQHSLLLAQRLYDENKARRSTGVATDLDVLTAEVGVATARSGVVTAEQEMHNSEDALLALTGHVEFNTRIGAVQLPAPPASPASFARSYQLARESQPGLKATEAAIKQFELDAATAKNSALPTLNLGGAVGYNGTDRSYGSALDQATSGEARNWQLDLSLSIPWGLHGDRARYRGALAGLRQEQASLQQIDQTLVVNVRTAVRAVETSEQRVGIFTQATELAVKQYELQLARFKAGLATSRQVLETQDDLESARVNELQARVSFHTALSYLHALDGSSLERYHVALAE